MGRAQHMHAVLAAAWVAYIGEVAAWERAAQVPTYLEVVQPSLGDLRVTFLEVLYTAQAIREGRGHAARVGWDQLERAAHAGILALVAAGYTFPLDAP